MQAEKQKSWKIYIHAKAKSFHFKLKATSIIPTWEFHHCSILLKLGKCILRLKSEYGTPINPKQPQCKTLRSKFIGFLKMFRFRRSKNRAIGFKHKSDLPHPEARFRKYHLGWLAYKELICMGSLVVGIFAFLSQTICNKDWWGITIHGCLIMLYFVLLFKKYMTGKISNFCILLMGTSVVCSLAFDLDKYLKLVIFRCHGTMLFPPACQVCFKVLSNCGGPGETFYWIAKHLNYLTKPRFGI